jgi:NAD(P)-dependent dehydrogenase (short-subunit alcohol dehydrogenase family)
MTLFVVTGANRGIGLALVRALAARGDTVVAGARRPEEAHDLAALAEASAGRIEILPLDVTDAGSVAAFAAALGDRAVDVLVNNAGIIGPARQSTLDMDFDGWLATFAVNTLGPLRVAQALLPHLRRAAGARILTISSRMGSMAFTKSDRIAYRSSKAAVNKAMQGLATDLAADGIAVAVAHPGWVTTDMGGRGADIDPDTSARGLVAVIDTLSAGDSPRFVNFDGAAVPW